MPIADKPKMTGADLAGIERLYAIDRTKYPLIVIGVRGYRDLPGHNKRGLYDDALFLSGPNMLLAFNGNTDPSKFRPGQGTGTGKGILSLDIGAWYVHRFDIHHGQTDSYLALCQRAGPVSVMRDGNPPYRDVGMFGVNIHRGGYTTTGSEGCQTIHPAEWPEFIQIAERTARSLFGDAAWHQVVIPYILTEK